MKRTFAILAATAGFCLAVPAHATDVYGRVFDSLKSEIYSGVKVTFQGVKSVSTTTDRMAQFRLDLAPGSYLVFIALPGEDAPIAGRLHVVDRKGVMLAHLDIAKIAPPHADEEY